MTQTTRTNHEAEIPLPKSTKETTDPVREMLDRIDTFLVTGDQHAERLWNVLSALRGPDNDSYGDKVSTTNAIRAAAFPRTAALGNLTWLPASFYTTGYREPTTSIWDYEALRWHFAEHIRSAAAALKLKDETGK